jgi:hypothetical protein
VAGRLGFRLRPARTARRSRHESLAWPARVSGELRNKRRMSARAASEASARRRRTTLAGMAESAYLFADSFGFPPPRHGTGARGDSWSCSTSPRHPLRDASSATLRPVQAGPSRVVTSSAEIRSPLSAPIPGSQPQTVLNARLTEQHSYVSRMSPRRASIH